MKNYIYLLGLGVIGLVACQKNYQAKPSDINNNYRITKFVSDSNDVISIQYTNDGRLSKIFSIDKHGIMHKDGYFEYSGNVVIKHTNSGEPYEWVTLNASGKPSTRITYKGYASNKPSIKFFDTLAYFYNNEGELKSLRAAADINSDTSKAFARVNYITVVEKDGDVTDVYSEKNELLAHFEYDTEHLNDLNMYLAMKKSIFSLPSLVNIYKHHSTILRRIMDRSFMSLKMGAFHLYKATVEVSLQGCYTLTTKSTKQNKSSRYFRTL